MNNTFRLEFDKTITKLAGNQLGKKIFRDQLQSKIDYSDEIFIVFPDRIDTIASSFIQGLFEDIVRNIGIIGVENQVHVESDITNLKEIIVKNLI